MVPAACTPGSFPVDFCSELQLPSRPTFLKGANCTQTHRAISVLFEPHGERDTADWSEWQGIFWLHRQLSLDAKIMRQLIDLLQCGVLFLEKQRCFLPGWDWGMAQQRDYCCVEIIMFGRYVGSSYLENKRAAWQPDAPTDGGRSCFSGVFGKWQKANWKWRQLFYFIFCKLTLGENSSLLYFWNLCVFIYSISLLANVSF